MAAATDADADDEQLYRRGRRALIAAPSSADFSIMGRLVVRRNNIVYTYLCTASEKCFIFFFS